MHSRLCKAAFASILMLASFARVSAQEPPAPSATGTTTSESALPAAPVSPKKVQCNGYFMEQRVGYTPTQRWCHFGGQLFTAGGVSGAALWAEYGELRNDPKEWGEGTAGYARRFGSNLAQGTAKQAGAFVFQTLLREDPRMFNLGTGGFWKRTGHAISNVFTAVPTSPAGTPLTMHRRLSPTWIAGSIASGFIGMTWYPERVNTQSDAWRRSGTALAGMAGNSWFHEFEPSIVGWIQKKFTPKDPNPPVKKKKSPQPAPDLRNGEMGESE